MHLYIIIFFILLNIFIYFNINRLIKIFNIFDKPNKTKIHKKKVSLIGGTILFVNIFIFLIFSKINFLNYFSCNKELISFFIIICGFYLVGLYDDKFQISPLSRIILMSLILYILITINNSLHISQINFSFIDKKFYLNNLSILSSIICILIFTYALNMFDGINLQSITYSIFIFLIFIFTSKFFYLSLIMIICLSFLLILNYKNKIFLGDSGIYILAGIISYVIIYEYNSNNKFFTVENIFIIMMIPGFDFIRLFIQRIINGKHPFLGDKKHLHHLLAHKFKIINVYLIICFLYMTPFFLRILGLNSYFIIMSFLLLYLFINFYFLKKFQ